MGAADVELVVGAEVNTETGKQGNTYTGTDVEDGQARPPVYLSTCVPVLLVDHADFLGGAERSALELLCVLDDAKFKVTLASPPGALLNAARAQGSQVAPVNLVANV